MGPRNILPWGRKRSLGKVTNREISVKSESLAGKKSLVKGSSCGSVITNYLRHIYSIYFLPTLTSTTTDVQVTFILMCQAYHRFTIMYTITQEKLGQGNFHFFWRLGCAVSVAETLT